jgi:hypothetical protein
MNNTIAGLLAVIVIHCYASLAYAVETPILMHHSLTGYNKLSGNNKHKGSKEITLDYSLHVENPGDTALDDLSLSLVLRPPFVAKKTIVNIGYLGPHQSADIKLRIATPMSLDPEKFARKPLSWAGKCLDAEGKLLEFPVKSRSGGAK